MPLSPQSHAIPRHRKPIRHAIGLACLALATQASAQATAEATERLPQVTVTGNPLGNNDGVQAVQALQGDALVWRSESTLGETLSSTPGVSSTYFGPNASRPIIRGMDGDRIKILNNSLTSQDLSALSNDHSVPLDTLAVERIEVLRGPSAIMYGGSAVGGVVNLIDNRIPSQPITGLSGRADVGWASGNQETRGAAMLELGNGQYAVHADAFGRHSLDQAVPDTLACEKTGLPSSAKAICNSNNSANGYALGGSVFWDKGYLGLSGNTYRSSYGAVAEDNVRIDMKNDRYALQSEIRQPVAMVDSLHLQWGNTDYTHTEFDEGAAGTVFAQKGNDIRLSAKHQAFDTALGRVQGSLGWQGENTQFVADGDEAFMPATQTRLSALYLFEEWRQPWGNVSMGLRSESVTVEGDAFTKGAINRDAAATSNRFSPISSALGLLVKLSPEWSVKGHLAQTQRAPKDYELRADGVHVATAAYEEGSTNLGTEKSRQVDLGVNWAKGPHKLSLNYFVTRFDNYIGLNANGEVVNEDDEAGGPNSANPPANCEVSDPENGCFTKYTFSASRAEFKGYELETLLRLTGNQGLLQDGGDAVWDLALRADAVRATNLDTTQALPRIPPIRLGATLARLSGPWRMALGVDHANAPRLGPDQRATSAYRLWNAHVSYRQKINANQALWYVRVDNLTDQLAYPATSVLTSTALDAVSGRPKAPLPGRSLKLGVQVDF
jgi:iron complex outermembrane receptor protein